MSSIGFLQSLSFGETFDPMGGMSIVLKGESDNYISNPFTRSPEYEDSVKSINGNLLTANSAPGWFSDQFVYGDTDSADPSNTYYLVILTGALEGRFFTVTANDHETLTLDLKGESLSSVQTELVDGVGMGDLFQLIPYWTPATLFQSLTAVPSAQGGLDYTQILIRSNDTIQVFKAPYSYSYFEGWGWYDSGIALADDIPIAPGHGLQIRTYGTTDVTLRMYGAVSVYAQNRKLFSDSDPQGNEFFYGVHSPVDVTLGASGIGVQDQIEIQVRDNLVSGYFKSPEVYVYFDGFGWYDGNFGVADSLLLKAGESFTIRKPSTGADHSVDWFYLPSYLLGGSGSGGGAMEIPLNSASVVTYDMASDTHSYDWLSKRDFPYFFEYSSDMVQWSFLNVIEPGDGHLKQWSFQVDSTGMIPTDKFFLRLSRSSMPMDDMVNGDADGDKIGNQDELNQGTSPLGFASNDADSIPDDWELFYGLDTTAGVDNSGDDLDGDFLTTILEFSYGSNPNDRDSDDDGLEDSFDIYAGQDPSFKDHPDVVLVLWNAR